jgi:hypothetical protein
MFRTSRKLNVLRSACALALLAPLALTAARAAAPAGARAEATAFIHQLAAGQFVQAETHFNATMRAHATPAKLHKLWQFMEKHFGPYAKTVGSDKMNFKGHPMVIVHTMFKRQTVGLAVFFDHAHQISGLRVVPIQ